MKPFLSIRVAMVLSLGFSSPLYASAGDIIQKFKSKNIKLVEDRADARADRMLLFLAVRASLKMEASLINQMGPGVTYYVVKDPQIQSQELLQKINPDLLNQIKIKFIDFDRCMTPWVQDYFLRMTVGRNRPLLLPTYSQNLVMNECKPFELGIADTLEKDQDFARLENVDYQNLEKPLDFFTVRRIDGRDGEMYGNSAGYKNMFPVRFFKYFYGEGGARVPSRRHLFIEREDLKSLLNVWKTEFSLETDGEALSALEKFLDKKVIPVGEKLKSKRFYIYHIDFFLTPVDLDSQNTVIFMGHPDETVKVLGASIASMPGYSAELFEQKKKEADLVESQLREQGFQVVRTPIHFMKTEGGYDTLTFNNVIQSKDASGAPAIFVPDYDLGTAHDLMAQLRDAVKTIYGNYGLKTHFVEGGEGHIQMSGQLRCSTGVLSYVQEGQQTQ